MRGDTTFKRIKKTGKCFLWRKAVNINVNVLNRNRLTVSAGEYERET